MILAPQENTGAPKSRWLALVDGRKPHRLQNASSVPKESLRHAIASEAAKKSGEALSSNTPAAT
jgi:hypothetical protein